jgi:hypothetical protein
MATIRKRSWRSGGELKSAWICDYADGEGTRRLKTFATKKQADAWLVQARHQVASGTHTADSASATIAEAADLWLARCERDNLEQSTMVGYRSHVAYHIGPLIGYLFFLLYISFKGQPWAIFKAKWHALLGLPKAFRKRRLRQASRTASTRQIHQAFENGFFEPYLQGYRRRRARRSLEKEAAG